MPKLLTTPFAASAAPEYRSDIQNSTGESPNSATYQEGFPPITFQPLSSSGIPPKGADFNGVLYDITDNIVFQTQGNTYPYNAAYATTIGGYPLNARIALDNGDIVRSTIASNTNDPNTDMTGWAYSSLIPSKNLNDVPDKAAARTNLGVYSKAETDAIAGTPSATETIAGKAKIATTAIAQAGTNDTDIITAKKLRDALNATGDAPISAIRSYVIGSATSAPTILRGMNVASVTKPASSQLTVNFIKPMTDTNYIVLAYAKYTAAPNEQIGGITTTKTVNSCTINFRVPGDQSDNAPEYTVVIL